MTEITPDTPEDSEITDFFVARKLVQLKQSADSRGLEFSLSFRSVKRLLLAKKCYYTGKPFGKGGTSRSIDRVDSSLGYIEGNVVPCTVDINQKKANLTTEEIHFLSKKIKLHNTKKKKK